MAKRKTTATGNEQPYHVAGCTCPGCNPNETGNITPDERPVAVAKEPYQEAVVAYPVVPPAVYRQMSEAAGDFAKAGLGKTDENVQQKFKFRGIDSLMNLAAPILVKHGLLVLPRVINRKLTVRETRNGGLMYAVALDVEFDFVSALDGSKHTARFAGEAMDTGDKATSKAMSMAYKYCLFQCMCIPVEGAMDEGDLTTPEETVAPAPAGLGEVKEKASMAAALGTGKLRDYGKSLKATVLEAAWAYLVERDSDWALIKGAAADADAALVPVTGPGF